LLAIYNTRRQVGMGGASVAGLASRQSCTQTFPRFVGWQPAQGVLR